MSLSSTVGTGESVPPEPTKRRLARALAAAGAPPKMVEFALLGGYDDFEADSATPLVDLVQDLRQLYGARGDARLLELVDQVQRGVFDGTHEEARAWAQSDEGRAVYAALFGPGKPKGPSPR